MGFCICPKCDPKTYDSLLEIYLNDPEWNLLRLQDMYKGGNSLEDIFQVVPFRKQLCNRTHKCCGICTRRCHQRCAQDCLNRLYMWRKTYESTPADQRDKLPLNIRMIAVQKFETLYDLSWSVSEIISANTNLTLRSYMDAQNINFINNPYRIDYAPIKMLDPLTGKVLVEDQTGVVQYYKWPQSGLCPYCLPNVTIYKGVVNRANRRKASNT